MEASVKSIFLVEWYLYEKTGFIENEDDFKYKTTIPAPIIELVKDSKISVRFLEDSLCGDLYGTVTPLPDEFYSNTEDVLFDSLQRKDCLAVVFLASGTILDQLQEFLEERHSLPFRTVGIHRFEWSSVAIENHCYMSFPLPNQVKINTVQSLSLVFAAAR